MKKGCGVYKRAGSPYYWGWINVNGQNAQFSTKETLKNEQYCTRQCYGCQETERHTNCLIKNVTLIRLLK